MVDQLKYLGVKFFFSTGLILILTTSLAFSQQPFLKLYDFKSAIIEYSYSGDRTGKGTIYIDDFGNKCAMFQDVISQGKQSKGWAIMLGAYQYMWNPDRTDDEGIKVKIPIVTLKAISKGDNDSFNLSVYAQAGMVKSGDEIFLGKECKVMKGDIGKMLTWNGILMLHEIKIGHYVSLQEVTSIKTNIPVDAGYFELPKKIRFSEILTF